MPQACVVAPRQQLISVIRSVGGPLGVRSGVAAGMSGSSGLPNEIAQMQRDAVQLLVGTPAKIAEVISPRGLNGSEVKLLIVSAILERSLTTARRSRPADRAQPVRARLERDQAAPVPAPRGCQQCHRTAHAESGQSRNVDGQPRAVLAGRAQRRRDEPVRRGYALAVQPR